jgi:uncharacterized protein YpmB
MKEAIFIGVVGGIVVAIIVGFVALVRAANAQAEAVQQEFKAACESVNGKAVWNRKYWECLK